MNIIEMQWRHKNGIEYILYFESSCEVAFVQMANKKALLDFLQISLPTTIIYPETTGFDHNPDAYGKIVIQKGENGIMEMDDKLFAARIDRHFGT
jgi:hypothetical protein